MRLGRELGTGRSWTALPLDQLLGALAALVLAVVVAWLAVVTLAALAEVLFGCSSRLLRAVSPAVVRRTVLICCGVAVGTGSVLAPASASEVAGDPVGPTSASAPPVERLLDGLRLPDRSPGRLPAPAPARTTESRPVPRPAAHAERLHRVRPGECLWTIAASTLPAAATPSDVDRAWRAIYRRNQQLIGADPHLLRSGTLLHLPAATAPRDRPGVPHLDAPTRKEAS
jgi:hypothetical protein